MDFPDRWADEAPDRVAHVFPASNTVVTRRELVDSSRRIARVFRGRGLHRGDTVAILLPNCPGFPEVAWACQRSGLRYVPISTHLRPSEAAYIITNSGARILVTDAAGSSVVEALIAEERAALTVFALDLAPTMESLSQAAAKEPAEPLPDEVEGNDLLYSSGTTGRPKGVALELTFPPVGTPSGVASTFRQLYGFDESTVYLSPAPLYHAAPLRTVMAVQRYGGSCVIMEDFDAATALALVQKYRVTHTQMVPTMFVRFLRLPEDVRLAADVSSLGVVIHAAAPCPPDVKRRMIEWLGPIVEEYYSATEGYLATAISSAEALTHPGSVGRAIIGNIHICSEEGTELPVGEVGLIWSEGGPDFEYLGDADKTAATRDSRGWRTLGDFGRVDEDGYLYLADRREDLILSSGVNVYPQEAENVLLQHPEVLDAAVFGVPHDEFGESVHAVVVPTRYPGTRAGLSADLDEYCRSQLSTFKCPRTIEFAASLPRTPTGKLLKRLLREERRTAHSPVQG